MTDHECAAAAGKIRDDVLKLTGEHEAEAHAGAPCWASRVGLLGYLAHCLALDDRLTEAVLRCRREYDRDCPGPGACPRAET